MNRTLITNNNNINNNERLVNSKHNNRTLTAQRLHHVNMFRVINVGQI